MDCDSDVVDDLNTGFIRKSVRWEDQQQRGKVASGKSRRGHHEEEGARVDSYYTPHLDSDFDSDLEDEKTLVVDVSNESSDFSAGTYECACTYVTLF